MGSAPEVTLSSACQMPLIGMGVAAYPFVESEKVKEAMLKAIEVGYRHFDTSPVYMTEQALGEAIVEALRLGLIKSRDELFITSKLWCCDGHHDRVIPALQKTLQALQLEYLDLFLIHWPISTTTPEKYTFPIPKDTLIQLDFESVWASMEECQRLGLTKSIGVSNFSCKKLETLLTKAKIPPAVVQVEMSPLWQQNKLRDFCKDKGITVVAYSPLGAKGSLWGTNRIMECVVLKEIAIAKGKTHAQICLRWVYEQRVGMLVKSFNEERMKENLEIFDWELSEEESKKISEIPQSRGLTADFFISADGPFKSKEELWDGEILS